MENKTIIGIIAIILGFLIIIFPFASQFALSIIFGIAFIILGIYYFLACADLWDYSKGTVAAYIILGILSLICGFILLFNIAFFDLLVAVYLYIFGFMIIITAIMRLAQSGYNKGIAALNLVLGIIVVLLGFYALVSPIYVAIIIGVALIVDGFGIAIGE